MLTDALRYARRTFLNALVRRNFTLANNKPLVSFTFDDFPRSAFLIGAHILEEAGARGTFYTAMGLMGKTNALGEHFRGDDLRKLAEAGHEIANHTMNHISCRGLSSSELRKEIEADRDAIQDCLGIKPSSNFAYPYGEASIMAKVTLQQETASCRGIYPGINGPDADLNLLAANSLYGDQSTINQIKRLLEENVQRSGWLIFYTHDLQKNPSSYGCTRELFESALKYALQTGSTVVTVNEALQLGRQSCA
jgi:peptidoglycan/xylan/chitin deacetylase (PgdA/CDA1 family)